MDMTGEQKEKVSADQWYGVPYEHIKASEDLSETTRDVDAVEGGKYSGLASRFGTVVTSTKPITFLKNGLNIDGGDLKVVFRNEGLRAVDASVRGVKKGSATKVTISAFDRAGKQLGTATETLGDGVSSILFEDLSSDVHELRFSGGSFVFLSARAINRISTTPVQNDW